MSATVAPRSMGKSSQGLAGQGLMSSTRIGLCPGLLLCVITNNVFAGTDVKQAGRIDDIASIGLAKTLAKAGFTIGRLRTGQL